MYYFQPAIKDTTLYLQQPTQNTGLDEILEISKTYYGDSKDISHPLLKFDLISLSSLPHEELLSVDLILKEAESTEIGTDLKVVLNPVASPWDMGIGTKFDDISTDGSTWNKRTNDYDWIVSGGDIVTGYETSQTLEYLGSDLEIDMSGIFAAWVQDTIENHGIMLSFTSSMESNGTDYGVLQYFSKESNTIYQPKLRIGWDDVIWSQGNNIPLTTTDIRIGFKRLKSVYKLNTISRISVSAKEMYPLKTYTNQYTGDDLTILPQTTFYQIKDSLTHEIIIPFSNSSKMSCDGNGNFFDLNFSNWEVGRDYYIEIKTTINGSEEIYSERNLTFTVEK